jgi:hypothetical protein
LQVIAIAKVLREAPSGNSPRELLDAADERAHDLQAVV